MNRSGKIEISNEGLCFSSSRAISYGNGLHMKAFAKIHNDGGRLRSSSLRAMGKNGVGVNQFPLTVETDHLASCAKAGVYGQDILLEIIQGII